jgi:hypothetical protein
MDVVGPRCVAAVLQRWAETPSRLFHSILTGSVFLSASFTAKMPAILNARSFESASSYEPPTTRATMSSMQRSSTTRSPITISLSSARRTPSIIDLKYVVGISSLGTLKTTSIPLPLWLGSICICTCPYCPRLFEHQMKRPSPSAAAVIVARRFLPNLRFPPGSPSGAKLMAVTRGGRGGGLLPAGWVSGSESSRFMAEKNLTSQPCATSQKTSSVKSFRHLAY